MGDPDKDVRHLALLEEPGDDAEMGDRAGEPPEVPTLEETDADVPVLHEDDDEDGLPPHAEPQPDGSVILPLLKPKSLKYKLQRNGAVREERFTQLHMHRLSGADMRVLSAAEPEDRLAVMLGRSCRMEHKMRLLFDLLDGADTMAAGRVANHFLSSGPRTGRST